MKRSRPLRRTGPLQRRTRLRPVSRERRDRGVPPTLREDIIRRDGGCLAVHFWQHSCGGRLDPHHVWRKGMGGPNEDWNLVALCRVAHDWVHAHPQEAIRLGLLSQSSLGEFGSRQAEKRRERRWAL